MILASLLILISLDQMKAKHCLEQNMATQFGMLCMELMAH